MNSKFSGIGSTEGYPALNLAYILLENYQDLCATEMVRLLSMAKKGKTFPCATENYPIIVENDELRVSQSFNIFRDFNDGTRVISGSEDRTIRLWDAVSGAHLNTLTGHSGTVNSVTFSPNGARVISGSWDGTLRLWDPVSTAPLSTSEKHSKMVLSVVLSMDGTRIASGSEDNTIQLWDAVSGAHLNTLSGHRKPVFSVAFSPDGTRVVSGSSDNTLRMWDAASGVHLDTLTGHSSAIFSVSFSGNGRHVVSGSNDETLRLWDAVSGALLNTLVGHSRFVRLLIFSPNGSSIASGSSDGTIQLWDTVSSTHHTLTGHSHSIRSIGFSPDGTRIVSASIDSAVRLWDVASGTHLDTFTGHPNCATSVANSLNIPQPELSSSQSNLVVSNVADPTLYYVMEDGWIFSASISQTRRLCWMPLSCRPLDGGGLPSAHYVHPAFRGNHVALGTQDGRVVILDFTAMDSYLDAL